MKPRGEIFSVVAGADLIASRPIAGHANLCPGSISTKPQELETLLSTVKHEILHALGFSVSLYAFYRDENGEPRTPRRSDTGKPPLNEKYVFSLRTHPAKIRPRSPLARLCIEIPLLTRARAHGKRFVRDKEADFSGAKLLGVCKSSHVYTPLMSFLSLEFFH